MCDVDAEAVVAAVDAPSIYEIPKVLHSEGLDAYVVRRLGPAVPRRRLDGLGRPARPGAQPAGEVTVGLVGKYIDLPDAYLSVVEALRAGGVRPPRQGQHPLGALGRVRDAGRAPPPRSPGSTAIVVPAASASAASRARSARCGTPASAGIPTLGLCLGLQCMVIEAARNLAGIADANSAEFEPDTPDPVIATMADQVAVVAGEADLGGTMRLGAYPANLVPGSVVARRLRRDRRCPSGTGTATRSTTPTAPQLEQAGLVVSGESPDGRLVEFVELPADVHPFFAATQAHPELKSRPTRAHPLFRAFVAAALAYNAAERLPVEIPESGRRGADARRPTVDGRRRADGRARRLRGARLRDELFDGRVITCGATTCG